jgi:2,3-bisphosphoglycerate-independent phosphoglycerate mutase
MIEQNNAKRPKPVILIILDGFGITQPYSGNAVALADKPVLDELIAEYPSMTLSASGEAVGLPWGESGNSEVGHINLGLGRIVYQDLPRINKAISDGSFYKNKALFNAISHAKANKSKLHLMGLVSSGGVHSTVEHLEALLALAKENKVEDVFVHCFLDGRDTLFNSGINYIKELMRYMAEYNIGHIASISGRFYAMDRDNRWERIEKAYMAMVHGRGNSSDDPISAVEESYRKKIYDEEFIPTFIAKNQKPIGLIGDNDAVVFFNYRPDRAREITKVFVLPGFEKFNREKQLKNLLFVCFTEYEKSLPVEVAFAYEPIKNTLGEIISSAGLKQLRISETEKYAHVTYFFNGGRESKSEGEDHILVPSPQVVSYDLKPEMSAYAVTDIILKSISEDKYDFILINYANPDMVAHTGNLDATIKAVQYVDECLGKVIKAVLAKKAVALITADHGNSESMINLQTGQVLKEHTANPVPFVIVGERYQGMNFGWQDSPGNDLSLVQPQGILSDVAPTVLKILNINKPSEMTGRSLI